MKRLMAVSVLALLLVSLGGGASAGSLFPGGSFVDDDGSIHEGDIEAIAAEGITKGCNPPINDRFCPGEFVTRGQMAAFLVRALGLTDPGSGDLFRDDDGLVFEGDIDRLGTAGITKGCNPPINDRFCPDDFVTRQQMATFIARALGLTPMTPPERVTFGAGTRVVGVDIPPGTYRNSDSSGGCFWERLSGFSGELDDTIANGFSFEIQIVDIAATDAGFGSTRCGTWSNDLRPRTSSPEADFDGGAYLVGSEVSPGRWRNSDSSGGCFWERLSGFSGELDDTITNEFSSEIQIIDIASTDVGFSSEGCGTWSRDLTPRTSSPMAPFGGGVFLVGSEVAPGLWRNSDSSDGCFWQRLSGFSGELDDTSSNGFSFDIQTVEIESGDVGFSSEGCGTWTKIG